MVGSARAPQGRDPADLRRRDSPVVAARRARGTPRSPTDLPHRPLPPFPARGRRRRLRDRRRSPRRARPREPAANGDRARGTPADPERPEYPAGDEGPANDLRIEDVGNRPFAGNDCYSAAESIDFDSSVRFHHWPLSVGRTLAPDVMARNERVGKDLGKNREILVKAAGLGL